MRVRSTQSISNEPAAQEEAIDRTGIAEVDQDRRRLSGTSTAARLRQEVYDVALG